MWQTPRVSGWPSTASTTLILDLAARRSASIFVNSGGMCWTSTMGTGKSPRSCGRTTSKAAGPPVDTPMATMSTRGARPVRAGGAFTPAAPAPEISEVGPAHSEGPRRQRAFSLGTSDSRTRWRASS